MTILSNLGQLQSELALSAFSQTKLWNREAEKITPVELAVYVRRMKEQGKEQEARSHVHHVLDAIRAGISAGTIQGSLCERMTLSEGVYTTKDLRTLLQGQSLSRRAAILFTLESGLKPEEITFLTHKRAMSMRRLTPLARSIVRSRPRHIMTPLLFWESFENRVLPVMKLKQVFERETKLGWWVLEDVYASMILVDEDAEYEAFVNEFARVGVQEV